MKKFCVIVAVSLLALGHVNAKDVNWKVNLTNKFTTNQQTTQNTQAPSWIHEVEFEEQGVRYFVGESRWSEHQKHSKIVTLMISPF